MESVQQRAQAIIENWFQKAADWQKDLFISVWNGMTGEDQILGRVTKLIGQEYLSENHCLTPNVIFPKDLNFYNVKSSPVILTSIAGIKGVGALSPQSTLEFSDGLTVVYGENGCGKSSYVRILKALENPIHSESVIGNVFEASPAPPEATVTFSLDGAPKVVQWNKNSKKRYPLQIYDTTAAKQFVDKENEVVYEPKVLAAITQMAQMYEKLSAAYTVIARDVAQKITATPQNLQNHPIAKEFAILSSVCDTDRFAKKYCWNAGVETEFNAIIVGLKENNPQKAATEKCAQRDIIRNHGRYILNLLQTISDIQCSDFLEKRKKLVTSKSTVEAIIKTSQDQSLISGFGTEVWKAMWKCACDFIEYIEGNAGIPATLSGRCALCQQELDANAKTRLQIFREFTESKVMTEAETAQQKYVTAVKYLQDNIKNKVNIADIEMSLTSSGVSEENKQVILGFYKSIVDRCEWLLSYTEDCSTELPPIQGQEEITAVFKEITAKMNTEIAVLQEIAKSRANQINRMNDLLVVRWAIDNLATKKQLIAYKEYYRQRIEYLKKHKRVSEYDSENLVYAIIENVIEQPEFSYVDCAVHFSLATLIKDFSLLTEVETKYASNPLTHLDFLLFNKMDKAPILAIEVDGMGYHKEGSRQSERDAIKSSVLEKYGIPLLRLRSNESGVEARIVAKLRSARLTQKGDGLMV